jgi:hypothetical protein
MFLAGAALLAAFAISAAGASAFVPEWEVKGPPTAYTPLALFTPETLHSKAAFGITGAVGTGPSYKSSCEGPDTETIENIGAGEGVDEMTAFEVVCNEGGDPYPMCDLGTVQDPGGEQCEPAGLALRTLLSE